MYLEKAHSISDHNRVNEDILFTYQVNNLNITAAPLTVRNATEKHKRHDLSVNVTRIYEKSE